MLRLEGSVNGRRVARDCGTADAVANTAAMLLDACSLHELRFARILNSLYRAAVNGRTWGWSAAEFTLTLHGREDDGD